MEISVQTSKPPQPSARKHWDLSSSIDIKPPKLIPALLRADVKLLCIRFTSCSVLQLLHSALAGYPVQGTDTLRSSSAEYDTDPSFEIKNKTSLRLPEESISRRRSRKQTDE
ncbi:hypothetical protein I7I53_00313 [Histoplasma capsulatum var. duboisii H88]|nr:hypothetical protein I7I53_00313 [Histoplasma capsulatum var. duboisii H88]